MPIRGMARADGPKNEKFHQSTDPKKVGNVSAAVPHLLGCRHRFGSQPGYGKYQNQAEEEAQSTIQKAKGHC